MRLVAAGVLVASACVAVLGVALAQKASSRAPLNEPSTAKAAPEAVVAAAPQSTAPAPVVRLAQAQPAAAPPPAPPPAHVAAATPQASAPSAQAVASCPGHPDALGVARVVEIDTTGGPGFGFEHFKAYDFLRPGEVVLTFDDGPWPNNTPAVLQALADHCTKATFFPIGKHAMWHPEILKQVAAAGHTIGSHTWSHADLSKKTEDEAKEEIERGISAVREALGAPESPFFRFPALRHPPAMLSYLEQRNIGIFSTDFDSFDFKIHKPDQLIRSVMTKLKKHGKGILLMHDFQRGTAQALPELLRQIKAGGYRIVQMKAKDPIKTLADYDAWAAKEFGGTTASNRPTASVVRTISGQ